MTWISRMSRFLKSSRRTTRLITIETLQHHYRRKFEDIVHDGMTPLDLIGRTEGFWSSRIKFRARDCITILIESGVLSEDVITELWARVKKRAGAKYGRRPADPAADYDAMNGYEAFCSATSLWLGSPLTASLWEPSKHAASALIQISEAAFQAGGADAKGCEESDAEDAAQLEDLRAVILEAEAACHTSDN